jgi:cyclohexanone monooxygenase
VDSHYYATYNRPNVTLVDVRSAPIEEITSTGLRTSAAHYELDALVFATGFDAMTGSLAAIDIRGRNGITLKDQWREGPATYLGMLVAGFPNLFIMTGPGSPSVLSNMVVSIEQHVEWASNCIADLRRQQLRTIEVTPQTQDQWMAHVTEVANTTLFPQANSWYTGANIPGKPKVFMPYVGGVGPFAQACADVAARNYPGCTLSA